MSTHTDDRPDTGYPERILRLRRRLERLIGIAATEGNALVPLHNGDEIFAAMSPARISLRRAVAAQ